MNSYGKIFFSISLICLTFGLSAQRKVEVLVERAIEEAESNQRLNGKYLIADFSELSNLKVIPKDVVIKVTEGKYNVRNIRTVRRMLFNKTHKHVNRFEFRDLALIRQDQIEAANEQRIRDSLRQIEIGEEIERRDSIKRVRAALLVEMNENRAEHLPGMWRSNVNEVIKINKNGVIEMVQLEGEQLSVRLYWKYDPANYLLLISNNQRDYTNLGRVVFSDIETVTLLRHDGKKFTMSTTSESAITNYLRSKALARDIFSWFGAPGGTMTRDDEEYRNFMHWRERGYQ